MLGDMGEITIRHLEQLHEVVLDLDVVVGPHPESLCLEQLPLSVELRKLLLELLLGLDFFQQGVALQFVAEDLFELEGGDLQQFEGLLEPLGHDQLLPQLHALS